MLVTSIQCYGDNTVGKRLHFFFLALYVFYKTNEKEKYQIENQTERNKITENESRNEKRRKGKR